MSSTDAPHFPPPELKAALPALRRLDNVTNWWYLGRAWAFLLFVIGGTIAVSEYALAQGGSLWALLPVWALSVVLVGAGQHQLAGATHEATHHTLFRNRLLNELASDWLAMFPLFSSTFHFRLHHLAHHQFVNDEQRDPDFAQLAESGHRFDFPLPAREILGKLLASLAPWRTWAYIVARARINSLGQGSSPYRKQSQTHSRAPALGVLFVLVQGGAMAAATHARQSIWLGLPPACIWAVSLWVICQSPNAWQLQTRLVPVIPQRLLAMQRVTFLTLLFWGIAWTARITHIRMGVYFLLLWVLPIFTSFAYFMILRQVVQHGNADRGRFTNTRVFLVPWWWRFAVFPFGMDYHLPHHLFATVPHYRLPELDRILRRVPEYEYPGSRVRGYLSSGSQPSTEPCVLEVLGPRYTLSGSEIHEDPDALLHDTIMPEGNEVIDASCAAQPSETSPTGLAWHRRN